MRPFFSRLLAISLVACHPPAATKEEAAPPATVEVTRASAAPVPPVTAVYPWKPTAQDRLDVRFAPPTGFTRAAVADGSFGAFLRTLPLLPAGAKVVDYRGAPLYDDGHHPNIAAVVDLDVGDKNLQQCADAVIRLHAEWKYGRGDRDMSYKSVSGTSIPYARYLAGDRAVTRGNDLVLQRSSGARADEHALFRAYLDDVFNVASTRSLERDAARVPFAELRAGDFFVMSGQPFGHAVLVLDIAKDDEKNPRRLALLLGQSFMPAQSFQVLRPDTRSTWFVVDVSATEVKTPFWPAFSTEMTRRL